MNASPTCVMVMLLALMLMVALIAPATMASLVMESPALVRVANQT